MYGTGHGSSVTCSQIGATGCQHKYSIVATIEQSVPLRVSHLLKSHVSWVVAARWGRCPSFFWQR